MIIAVPRDFRFGAKPEVAVGLSHFRFTPEKRTWRGDWQFGGRLALEDASGIYADKTIGFRKAASVAMAKD